MYELFSLSELCARIYDGRYFDPSTRTAISAVWQLAEPASGTAPRLLYTQARPFASARFNCVLSGVRDTLWGPDGTGGVDTDPVLPGTSCAPNTNKRVLKVHWKGLRRLQSVKNATTRCKKVSDWEARFGFFAIVTNSGTRT